MLQQLQKIPAIFEKSNLFNMSHSLYIVPLPSYYLKPFITLHPFISSHPFIAPTASKNPVPFPPFNSTGQNLSKKGKFVYFSKKLCYNIQG